MRLKFAFMLKSYSGDLKFVVRLVGTFHKHNIDNLTLFLVAPAQDLELFRKLSHPNLVFIAEEQVPCKLLPASKIPRQAGYINQQVLKLSFHRLNLVENYLALDSDGVFIRDFTQADFIHEDGRAFQVLVEDKLLKSDADYFDKNWEKRAAELAKIQGFLEIQKSNLKTCHGFQILQSKVLREFEKDILRPKELEFIDLVQEFGYEFTWYNYFLQGRGEPIHEVEPFFHCVHSGVQLVDLQTKGSTTTDFSRGFVGIIVNGNFQYFSTPATLESRPIINAAAYLESKKLLVLILRFSLALLVRVSLTPILPIRRVLQRAKSFLRS
jgi:hypothetical protein